MYAYIVRRVIYAFFILIGVNLITFALFFVVNTPDDMARMQLGVKRVTPEAIQKWKMDRGYYQPLLWNAQAAGLERALQQVGIGGRRAAGARNADGGGGGENPKQSKHR